MPEYTVQSATQKKTLPGKHGEMQVIALTFTDGTSVEWFTKAETALPSPGSTLEGDVTDGPYGKKFTKAKPAFGGGRPRDPRETAAIQRQHSQEMSLRAVAIAVQLGLVEVEDTAGFFDLVGKTADWFDRDIRTGSERALGGPQTPRPAPVAESPAPSSLDEETVQSLKAALGSRIPPEKQAINVRMWLVANGATDVPEDASLDVLLGSLSEGQARELLETISARAAA